MKNILCAILCYNNKNTITKVVKERKKLKNLCDVIFVNDGSTDNTVKILNSLKTKVITHKKNLGYGQAVKSAFKYAKKKKYKYLAIFPADGQRHAEDLIKMFKIIQHSSLDLILGSKFETLKKIPFHRKVGNIFFSKVAKIFWNSEIKDVLSGFKIYKIKSFSHYLSILPRDYSLDIILTQLISFNKMKFIELSVRCRYNNNTTSMKGVFKIHKKNIIFIGLKMLFDSILFYTKYKLFNNFKK